MDPKFRILCLGDVVGTEGTNAICSKLWQIRRENNISMVVLNCENADPGNGITAATAKALLDAGADVLTSGNHIWQKKDMLTFLDDCDYILRPANYPDQNPGRGYLKIDIDGYRVLVINVQGTVYMESLADPFSTVDKILEREKGKYDLSIMDIHAEATSEKLALARYFDGRINVIVGTHTHVQTADAQILPGGTGYITDLGMCGSHNGILGVRTECIIDKFRSKMPTKFLPAEGNVKICGCIFGTIAQKGTVEIVKNVEF